MLLCLMAAQFSLKKPAFENYAAHLKYIFSIFSPQFHNFPVKKVLSDYREFYIIDLIPKNVQLKAEDCDFQISSQSP